jgi:chromatin structure-remodeling complex protein RSC7
VLGTPTPQVNEQSDEEMQDVPPSDAATPQEDDGEDQDEDGILEDGDEDEPSTPANESRTPSRNATPGRTRGLVPQKRRAGRPPKNPRPHDWEAPDDGELGTSDVGTPRKRGGWRGRGFGGGRWGKPRGGPSHATQVPLDKEGNMANVVDDEVELPDDPEGEQKVDKDGHLKGGREYRVRVFTIQGRGNRLYMLSTEPARCIGFRDSYLFFQKHPQLYKIILPEDAKRDLIDRNLIPHSYKGRAIGVVTARSVFREFGAKIIIGGKKIIDDYQVTAARANGDIEGELAVPEDRVPASGQAYDKNRYVAWHGASSVYHANNPSVPMPNGKIMDGKKRKVHVTGANWMFEHAQEAR